MYFIAKSQVMLVMVISMEMVLIMEMTIVRSFRILCNKIWMVCIRYHIGKFDLD